MYRSASLIFASNSFALVLSFLRNILIARMIDSDNFGIGASFALALAAIEAGTNVGLDRYIVQNDDNEDPQLQANLQGVQILRGIAGTIAGLCLSIPYAAYLNNQDYLWAYQMLCLVPLSRAFLHLDIYRFERRRRFLPGAVSTTLGPLIGLTVGAVIAFTVRDFRAMLFAVLGQHLVFVVSSHVVSERRFEVTFDRWVWSRAAQFGAPLWVNSLLIFAVHNGESLLVGGLVGMGTLAVYYNALLMTLNASFLADTTLRTWSLPRLADLKSNPTGFNYAYASLLRWNYVATLVIAGGSYLVGAWLYLTLFGEHYSAGLAILAPLGIASAIKTLKVAPNTAAIALGQTGNLVLTNLPRVLSLPISAILLHFNQELSWVVLVVIIAEMIGVLVANIALARRASLSSIKEMSFRVSPARFNAFWVAGTGPIPMMAGSTPATAMETIRPSG